MESGLHLNLYVIFIRWVLINTFGLALSASVTFFFVLVLVRGELWFYIIFAAILGSLLGFFQWLTLRRCFSNSHWWILNSSIGLLVGGGIAYWSLLNWTPEGIKGLLIFGAALGLPLGIAQWFFLWRRVKASVLWVVGTIVGLLFGLLLSSSYSTGSADSESVVAIYFLLAVLGLMIPYNGITGLILVGFLKQLHANSSNETNKRDS